MNSLIHVSEVKAVGSRREPNIWLECVVDVIVQDQSRVEAPMQTHPHKNSRTLRLLFGVCNNKSMNTIPSLSNVSDSAKRQSSPFINDRSQLHVAKDCGRVLVSKTPLYCEKLTWHCFCF